ncbi:MAG: division/cell wall cluster transcriptional repressor MraZ [Alphaproteobacteria bacterium]|nr:division/cell wall cluster transcriptional repressor MraZ [Alphaproteobacteria bacterium]
MALFLSTTINKIDAKGRVSVPAPFRNALAGQEFHGIVAVPLLNLPGLQCGGLDWMEGLLSGVDQYDQLSEEQRALTFALFGSAEQLGFDGDGRITLPESLIGHANLTDQAAFVGVGKTFEIWEPQAAAAYKQVARQQVVDLSLTLRPPSGGSQ